MEHRREGVGRVDAAAAMLTVSTWLWGDKFSSDDVKKLAGAVKRNLKQPHRFVCITNNYPLGLNCEVWPLPNESLTHVRGCFARLRMFDADWQVTHGIGSGERIALIDLDTVVTGPIDRLFDRPESFVIMQKGNASNPCPFNGALQMLRAGAHPEVWSDFSVEAASRVPFFEFPDDQGWLWHKLPGAAGWKCGVESGVFVFHKPGWPGWKSTKDSTPNDDLPKGARLVTFSGWRNPKRFSHLDWVKQNWAA